MDSREQLWHATDDHIRDLMELVEGRLVGPSMQRRWRLAMSAFARRAAEATILTDIPQLLDTLDTYVDGGISRETFEPIREQYLRYFLPMQNTTPEDFAMAAVSAACHAFNTDTSGMFHAMYWQHAEFAFEDAVAEYVVQATIFKDIFGNPFRPVAFDPPWRSESAVALARTAYESRNFTLLPILADALEEAGCDHPDVLTHCRQPDAVHVRGCWVVDGVLGKA